VVTISPAALAASLGSGDAHELLDVRTSPEYSSAHQSGPRLIPLGKLRAEAFLAQQKPGMPIHVLRQAGAQAKKAIELSEHSGCGNCDVRLFDRVVEAIAADPAVSCAYYERRSKNRPQSAA
jgi:rhodanese-related sulfurtransferase